MRIFPRLCGLHLLLFVSATRLARPAEPPAYPSGAVSDLVSDLRRVTSLNAALDGMATEMTELQLGVRLVSRGHYTADEHDAIEKLLFRFLLCRESLWDVVSRYREYETRFAGDEENQMRGFLIGFQAALALADHSSLLVATFMEEERAVRKLNEAYPRSDLPAGTFDRLFASLTKVEHLESLRAAWLLFTGEWRDESSVLRRVLESDPLYQPLRLDIARRHRDAEMRTEYILMKSSLVLPEVRNRLRHTRIAELASSAKAAAGSGFGAVKGFLFTNVSRLRGLDPDNLAFTAEELAGLKARLRPGDVVLTFSDGYMSNLFLPGTFKHGLTYVGSPSERRGAGLPQGVGAEWPEHKRRKLAADLEVARLPSGHPADVIEAVAEGVVFNSLQAISDNHVARLLVLRPRLTEEQRRASLANTFLLLGNEYDFDFDFVDGSRHCCTEVIYRALHKAGPISFDLVPRAGTQTLAADDIVRHHLRPAATPPFELVFLAEADPAARAPRAIIRDGPEGTRRLVELMGASATP